MAGEQGEPGGRPAAARGPVDLAVAEDGHVPLHQAARLGGQFVENHAVDAAEPAVGGVHRGAGGVQLPLDQLARRDQLRQVFPADPQAQRAAGTDA